MAKLKIDILTLFPEMFGQVFSHSIIGRACDAQKVEIAYHDFRAFSENKHKNVDDYPYGGGAGLVLTVQPIFSALANCVEQSDVLAEKREIIMMTPQGEQFSHKIALELAQKEHLVFVCGHYEGFDERIREHLVTRELSLGDFVLTGGEMASMAMIDATVRLMPDVIQKQSHEDDSFATGLLEYPQYTRPRVFNGWEVPQILLSGHHLQIDTWRKEQSLIRTKKRRPDLLK
ncbi:tRNA m(1)G37 methyltransferase [Erysipelotrichaceae bacterium]|nr:tRNA m(1)G37 methyltransferase [Erysipelotrichaceae bacterium]